MGSNFDFKLAEDLFSLLMDLAINTGSKSMHEEDLSRSMSSLACSALISLTIGLGDTEKLLRAVTVMLMSRSGLELQDIVVCAINTTYNKIV